MLTKALAGPVSVAHGRAVPVSCLAQSMAAFYTDMGPTRMNDICLMVVSEFGRQVEQNDSSGTDHGVGGMAIVMSNNISTPVSGNSWPGLSNILHGDSLNWNVDFRDIYWEVLSRHMGLDNTTLSTIIPGHTYTPVNFMV